MRQSLLAGLVGGLVATGLGGGAYGAHAYLSAASPKHSERPPVTGRASQPDIGSDRDSSTMTGPTVVTPAGSLSRSAGRLPVAPPGPGRYHFVVTGDLPGDAAFDLSAATAAAGGLIQTASLVTPNGSQADTVLWRPDGRYVERSTFTANGLSFDCIWSKPILDVKLPLAVGDRWSVDSSCPISLAGQQGTMTQTATTVVRATTDLAVSGRSVHTLVLERTATVTIRAGVLSSLQRATETDYFAPALGMFAGSDGRSRTDVAGTGGDHAVSLRLASVSSSAW